MKSESVAAFALLFTGSLAFQPIKPSLGSLMTLQSTVAVDVSTTLAKTELLETAESLNQEFGCLIIDSKAQDRLKAAVDKLESVAEAPKSSDGLIGQWTLLCSTASASLQGPLDKINGIDTSKLPFFNEGPIKSIRDTLNKALKVEQVVTAETTAGTINRIDHVLQYVPPDTLSAFLDNVPETLKNFNINPLEVTKSKVILVHKAEVESVTPTLQTKLSLSSIIVNVAGKSQRLDPQGADVLGINLPFGEFLNAGGFETTYMDDTLRISRSKVGIVDQLRVFVRSNLEQSMSAVETSAVNNGALTITDADVIVATDDQSASNDVDVDDISPSDY